MTSMMPSTILAIGLEAELLNSLTQGSSPDPDIVAATSFDEALAMLRTADVSTVLIDSRSSSQLREDVNMLLADTPVTTTIVLIIHPSDFVSPEIYAALGVRTLESPVSAETLTQALV